ncbi:hypothetical protein Tco_0816211 [Tanacetum coccineum]
MVDQRVEVKQKVKTNFSNGRAIEVYPGLTSDTHFTDQRSHHDHFSYLVSVVCLALRLSFFSLLAVFTRSLNMLNRFLLIESCLSDSACPTLACRTLAGRTHLLATIACRLLLVDLLALPDCALSTLAS